MIHDSGLRFWATLYMYACNACIIINAVNGLCICLNRTIQVANKIDQQRMLNYAARVTSNTDKKD